MSQFRLLLLFGCFLFGQWVFFVAETTAQKSDAICLDAVAVVDVADGSLKQNQRIYVLGEKIVAITGRETPITGGWRIIDGGGGYVVPSLGEMHYHLRSELPKSDAKLLLANGIGVVRNMASFDGQDHLAIRAALAGAAWPGPLYFTAGPYLRATDLPDSSTIQQVVARHRELGYDFLKLADNLPLDHYQYLLALAAEAGVRVVGHAQRHLPLPYSLRMDAVEHLEEFLYVRNEGEAKSLLQLNAAELAQLAQQVKASGVAVGTTLSVFDFIRQCTSDSAFAALAHHPQVDYVAAHQQALFLTEKNDYRKLKELRFDKMTAAEYFDAQFACLLRLAMAFYEAGVPLLIGSDTYGMVVVGFSLHEELAWLQTAGIPAADLLRMATLGAADFLGIAATHGSIAPGKAANMLLLAENPLADIRHTRSLQGHLHQGVWYSRETLDQMLETVKEEYR